MPVLDWIGKAAVVRHHQDVPYRLLEPVPALSCEPDGAASGNLIVQGDNLHALKALLPRYAGQVKCVYIDPPYNTGNEGWVYNDNVNSPEIRRWLGEVVGKEGETLDRHDRWLCMMYPRLVLLRQFLRDDGAIFISIDETEQAHLRLLMDEVFGSSNFIADMVWAAGRKNDSKLVSVSHEYIVAYARSKSTLAENGVKWRQRKKGLEEIHSAYRQFRKIHGADHAAVTLAMKDWFKGLADGNPAKAHRHFSHADARGLYFPDNISWPGGGGPRFEVLHPTTGRPVKVPGRGWMTSDPAKFQSWVDDDRVHFGADETTVPCIKSYLRDKELQTPYSVFYQDGRAATKRLRGLMGGDVFEFPKDEEVLAEVFSMLTGGDDIILDSFSGSGTTAHAVLKLNSEDGGNRRFILVEMDEGIASGVTAERVKRVVEGYEDSKGDRTAGLGGGFQFCKLSEEPLFTADGQIREDVRFAELAEFVWFSETGTAYRPKRKSALLGVHDGRAIYLLYNGILGDQSVDGGNVLTAPVLDLLPRHSGPRIVYAAACRLGTPRLRREGIVFKQTPYALDVTP